MTEPEIYPRFTRILRDVLADDAIVVRPETTASDIGGWDSQAHVALIVAAEMEFKVRFRTAEIESLKSVGEFVRLIAMKSA